MNKHKALLSAILKIDPFNDFFLVDCLDGDCTICSGKDGHTSECPVTKLRQAIVSAQLSNEICDFDLNEDLRKRLRDTPLINHDGVL